MEHSAAGRVPEQGPDEPADTAAPSTQPLPQVLEHLSELTTHVDRLSAKPPLSSHPELKSQLRRSAIDALASAACALEVGDPGDRRSLCLRALGATIELVFFVRLAREAGALTNSEAHRLQYRTELTTGSLQQTLARERSRRSGPTC